ncbi:hypothetical protein MP228_005126 [Amoeboaphelidium protococcarum]|nr:hypothetical protein MP228_005126 [Amoeboaphelidium protococcarum]
MSALMIASYRGNSAALLLLLTAQSTGVFDVNQRGQIMGMTALMLACSKMNSECVRILLRNGADVNTQNRINGYSALMYVASSGSLDSAPVARLLLDKGSDIRLKNNCGQDCIQIAQKARNFYFLEAVQGPLQPPTDRYDSSMDGISGSQSLQEPKIFSYIKSDNIPALLALLSRNKSSLYKLNASGDTPLIFAASLGNATAVKLLLDYGADVNVRNQKSNWTPLMAAVACESAPVVELLLECNADISHAGNIYDADGVLCAKLTARDFAQMNENAELLRLIDNRIMQSGTASSSSTLDRPLLKSSLKNNLWRLRHLVLDSTKKVKRLIGKQRIQDKTLVEAPVRTAVFKDLQFDEDKSQMQLVSLKAPSVRNSSSIVGPVRRSVGIRNHEIGPFMSTAVIDDIDRNEQVGDSIKSSYINKLKLQGQAEQKLIVYLVNSVFVLGIYGILFGVTILMAEFKLRFLVVEYCGFLNNLLGRGLYYVFVGVLMLEMQPVYILVLSIVVLAIGFAYILLWFIPAARPSKVTATQG